jgi:hypothetical protein
MADSRLLYLLEKYPQEVAGCAPWPRINALSDEEIRRTSRSRTNSATHLP